MTWDTDGDIDYSKYTESQLLQVVQRIDPKRYPINYFNLRAALKEFGYDVQETSIGLATARWAASDGSVSSRAFTALEFPVSFGLSKGPLSWLEPARNDLLFVGSGTVRVDGVYVYVTGRRYGVVFGLPLKRWTALKWSEVVNVEMDDNVVRFEIDAPRRRGHAVTLWLADSSAAKQLTEALPTTRTATFTAQLGAHVDFEKRLLATSPRTPVTYALIAANILIFAATLVAGAGWFRNTGAVQITWGSNFGPFTTDGEWWRLLTSLFLHFGVLHLLLNMWALASFGSMAERLYGRASYLLIYFTAGLCGSVASISWRPEVNSAGASAAIFGILGALLAGQLRSRKLIPRSVLRPLIASTLIFTGIALAAGMTSANIDNAAHVGGLAAGLLLGAILARSKIDESSLLTVDSKKFLAAVTVAIVVFGFGIWTAQRASASLSGEALYLHTIHWFTRNESLAVQRLHSIAAESQAGRIDAKEFAKRWEARVLPFWREANARIATIHLSANSGNLSNLEYLRTVIHGRFHAYELCVKGLRLGDDKLDTECANESARIDKIINDRIQANSPATP